MTNECVLCQRPCPDGYACPLCASVAAQNLARVVQLAPEARAVSYGLQGRSQGGASGKPGSRSPGNDDALDAMGEVQNTLTTWARHVAEERSGVDWHPTGPGDAIAWAANYLLANVEWLRHRAEVDEAFRDFAEVASKLRWIVDGPAARRYLGPCGAPTEEDHSVFDGEREWTMVEEGPPCEGDVYGRAGAKTGTCRTCGAQVDQAERRAWLDEQVAGQAFRAAHIADAYGLNVKTIRSWATDRPEVRAENGNVITPARPAKLRKHGHDRLGRPLYLVRDVLDLARAAAIRRAENEAKRERREVAA